LLSRKTTEELAGKLKKAGINAKAYHAGFDSAVRSQNPRRLHNDDCQVVCATIALYGDQNQMSMGHSL
jgi:ATP-dependent DNA helicase RecQ